MSKLNPSASEFVPSGMKFSGAVAATGGQAQATSCPANNNNHSYSSYNNNGYHQQSAGGYNNSGNKNRHYNNNNSGSSRGGGGGNNNYNNQHHYYNNNSSSNSSNQHQGYNAGYYNGNQSSDVDPIEIEARCEAVIEILQDDKIREHLNPVTNNSNYNQQPYQPPYSSSSNNNYAEDNEPQVEDEEEMLEMMAMQEECRLEMMKFYIQSQNPSLFEEIYHDVSYPDAVKSPPAPSVDAKQQPSAPPAPASAANADDLASSVAAINLDNESAKKAVKQNLDSQSDEFVPKQYQNADDAANPQ